MGILRTDRVSGLGGANAITGSTFFGGSGNHLRVEGIDDDFVTWWTADFTIEAWIFVPAIERWYYDDGTYNFPVMVGHMDPTSGTNYWSFGPTENNIIKFYYWKGSQNHTFVSTATVKENEWTHIAMTFSTSNGAKLFVNGTGTDYISLSGTPQVSSSNTQFVVGQYYNQNLSGNISNLRILKGTALYTSDFTPPTNRLEKTSDTKLLICNSASDVTHNDDEKIITPVRSSTNNTGPVASRFTPNSPVGFSTTTDVGTQFGSTFDGVTTFDSKAYFVPPGGNTRERNRGRGIFADGDQSTDIEFVNIQSMGNSQEFGDSTTSYKQRATVGSSTRAVTAGGFDSPAFTNIIDFITIANTANATDFGDLLTAKRNMGGAGNNTRGIYLGGGNPGNTNTIEFITIATAGNAQDFGDATAAKSGVGSLASPTRACFGGGQDNTIEFVTIATTGNASDFGDLISGTTEKPAGTSSSTRGLFICGESQPSGTRINTIQFITIASTGNATDFGDHTDLRRSLGACNNSIRAVYGGGNTPSATVNSLSFVTIASTGNGKDFGDLLSARSTALTATSDSHGGLE